MSIRWYLHKYMPKFSKADAFPVFLSIFRLNGTISTPYVMNLVTKTIQRETQLLSDLD